MFWLNANKDTMQLSLCKVNRDSKDSFINDRTTLLQCSCTFHANVRIIRHFVKPWPLIYALQGKEDDHIIHPSTENFPKACILSTNMVSITQ